MSEFDPFAQFYDGDYGDYADDLVFYREIALRTDGPILELMCGSGRVLLPLAEEGYRLTGVDISGTLLALADAKLQAAGLREQVDLVEADVRNYTPASSFPLAIVALNSFMHLTETADQLAMLQHIHAALEPDGLLVLDLYNPDLRELMRHNGELVFDHAFALEDGTTVQKFVVQAVDPASQISSVTFLYDQIDASGQLRRVTLPFEMRWLYRYELEHLLARAGFAIEAIYGSYDLDDYTSTSDLLLTVARKI